MNQKKKDLIEKTITGFFIFCLLCFGLVCAYFENTLGVALILVASGISLEFDLEKYYKGLIGRG